MYTDLTSNMCFGFKQLSSKTQPKIEKYQNCSQAFFVDFCSHLWKSWSCYFILLLTIYINKILRAKSGLFQTPPRKMHRSWQVGSQMKACNLPEFTSGQKFAKNSACAHAEAVSVAKWAQNLRKFIISWGYIFSVKRLQIV